MTSSINGFAVDLYGRLSREDRRNLCFSPASIHAVLSMTLLGAKQSTHEELARVLHLRNVARESLIAEYGGLLTQLHDPPKVGEVDFEGDKPVRKEVPAFHLYLANALWSQPAYPFDAEYRKAVQDAFRAELRELDFAGNPEAGRTTINDWVEKKTLGRIRELLAKGLITEATRLVLTNAVYFKSNWAEEFGEHATKPAPFRLEDGGTVDVDQMHLKHDFPYFETGSHQMLVLPYKAGTLDMVVLLPRTPEGLSGLEAQLTLSNLEAWLQAGKTEEVQVTLPKWKTHYDCALSETLKAMGARLAFTWPGADFTGMSPTGELYISEAVHKAFIAVDETGTEAAAATAAAVAAGCAPNMEPKKPKVFTADRPYLYAIRHRPSRTILFLGRVTNPAS